jgi:sRNA-binding protein
MSVLPKQLKTVDKSYASFQAQLKATLKLQKKLEQALRAYKDGLGALASETSEAELLLDSVISGKDKQHLLDATKQMQETQMSFNLQYLQLQSQMQHENQSYTAVSNIMKTKHDTVKNSISNIR